MATNLNLPRATYEAMERLCSQYDIDFYMLCGLIRIESNFDPWAQSPSQSQYGPFVGLMQMGWYIAKVDYGYTGTSDQLKDAVTNLEYGCRHYNYGRTWCINNAPNMVKQHGPNVCGLSAYYAGVGSVRDGTIHYEDYVQPIQKWEDEYKDGNIIVDGIVVRRPNNGGGDGGGNNPDIPDSPDSINVVEVLSKYLESTKKTQEIDEAGRQYPPIAEYTTDLGRSIAAIGYLLRYIRLELESWLNSLDSPKT